jgi:hypothetical protein
VCVCVCVKGKETSSLLLLHESRPFRWIGRIQELRHGHRKFFELYGLRDIGIEARFHALFVYVAENVGRKRDDWVATVPVLLLPSSDLFASLVPVFVGHMQIAL